MTGGGISPDFSTFEAAYRAGRAQILHVWSPADLETPVSAFLKLTRDEPRSFLLESVEGGAIMGRYSVIGVRPDLIWRYDGGQAFVNDSPEDVDPLSSLRRLLTRCRIDDIPNGLPPMAASGLFGYMGYDMIRLYEDIPDSNPETLGIPEGLFVRPTAMAIFDNVKHMLCLAVPVHPSAEKAEDPDAARRAYDAGVRLLDSLSGTLLDPLSSLALHHDTALSPDMPVSCNFSARAWEEAVAKAVDHIGAGDIFQVVLSQRMTMPFDLPPFDLYRSLRRVNPSPFLFYFHFDDFSLIGASPEIMVRVRGGTITLRPIAGTRRRGKTPEEDRALAAELLADPKERAEHLMLLDLGRNDVGRVAETGSVHVTDSFFIEYYSHVMHIVSNVEGHLRSDLDSLDALFAGFPAGTVSGAPKVRAMEIIDDLEPVRRSFYGGCAGYLSGNGDLDTCICLRTCLVKNGEIIIQSGAGIVADSSPQSENRECINKASALIDAARLAIAGALRSGNF